MLSAGTLITSYVVQVKLSILQFYLLNANAELSGSVITLVLILISGDCYIISMVPTTRGQKTSGMTLFDTVEYLVVDVMSLSNNVVTAIKDAGVVTVADMLSLDDDTINDLDAEVTDPNDPTKFITVPLKKLEYSKLRRFGAFNMYLCNSTM